MVRVKFGEKGEQRKFLKLVLERVNCPSLRAFEQFGFDVPYSTMKNYLSEQRLLPEELFREFLRFAKLKEGDFSFEFLGENWGRAKGGKISQRKKSFNS